MAYGGATYTYGANGELLTKTDASGTTEYTYDSFGNLRNVTPPTGNAVDYVIDGVNRRVGRKAGGTLVQGLLYQNQLNVAAELDGSGNLVAEYVYGTKGNVPDVKTDGTGRYRILSDHLGSPRLLVDTADGTVVERMDFDEWGKVEVDTAPGTTPFGFAGGLYERSDALVRFGARDYEPVIGRWVVKDPTRFAGGANLFAYANLDPINQVDIFGRNPGSVTSVGNTLGQLFCIFNPELCDFAGLNPYRDPSPKPPKFPQIDKCAGKVGRELFSCCRGECHYVPPEMIPDDICVDYSDEDRECYEECTGDD